MEVDYKVKVINIDGMTAMYWNTERMYTPGGQRIVATPFSLGEKQDKDVFFWDLDRHINGILVDCPLIAENIMKGYDRNHYHPIGNQDEYCIQLELFAREDQILELFR